MVMIKEAITLASFKSYLMDEFDIKNSKNQRYQRMFLISLSRYTKKQDNPYKIFCGLSTGIFIKSFASSVAHEHQ